MSDREPAACMIEWELRRVLAYGLCLLKDISDLSRCPQQNKQRNNLETVPHVCEKCVPLSKRLRTEASNGTTDRTSAPVKLYRLRRENSYECSVRTRLRSEYHCATKGWRWTQTTRRRAGDGETNDSSFIIIIRAACVGHSERERE